MTVDLTTFDANCLLKYTNGRVSTTGNELSLGNCVHIDLEETMQYALTQTTRFRAPTKTTP